MKTLLIVCSEKWASLLNDLFLISPIFQSDKSSSKSTTFSLVIINRVWAFGQTVISIIMEKKKIPPAELEKNVP